MAITDARSTDYSATVSRLAHATGIDRRTCARYVAGLPVLPAHQKLIGEALADAVQHAPSGIARGDGLGAGPGISRRA